MDPQNSKAFGIGTERCTTNCFGNEITMNETSRSQNHKFLYLTNSLYIFFSVAILAVGSVNLDSEQLMELFPFSKRVITGLICLGSFTLVAGVIGLYGTYNRNKVVLVIWIFMTVLLTISEIIAAAILQTNLSDEEYDKYTGTQFKTNWIKLAKDAENDKENLEWMQDIQERGACCGWMDVNSPAENPAWMACDAATTYTCNEYFRDTLSSQFGSLQNVTLALSIVQLVLMISTFALICRLKEFYKSENIDFGDYVHVPFGVRSLQDLGL